MKVCPKCQNTYTDNSLQFCLQDGTPLVENQSTADWTEPETVISPHRRASIHNTQNPQPTEVWQPSQDIGTSLTETPKKKSNTFQVLILAGLGLFVFLGLVGFGTWVLIRNMQNEIANKNSNKGLTNFSTPGNLNTKQSVNTSNANKLTNVNTVLTPTPTPTPKPTLKPEDAARLKEKIADTIDGWKSALESNDINGHLHYYGDTIDYYNAGRVSLSKIRADKQRAFNMYSSIDVNISNINTTIDDAGEKVTSVFDKEWIFENDEKTNSGKVRQQLQFAKIGGEWRIISEKDLKVYYVNK